MPCNSDYLAPCSRECELRRAAWLLLFVKGHLGEDAPKWLSKAADDLYCSDDRAVLELCEKLKSLTPDQMEKIVYNGRDRTSRDLADWWDGHEAADVARKNQEKANLEMAQLHRSVRSKLTPDELRAVGLQP